MSQNDRNTPNQGGGSRTIIYIIVAIIDGKPWLVATDKHWVWN